MRFQADSNSNLPLYIQLANWLEYQIEHSAFQTGKLPSERALASQTGLSRGTVKNAYQLLASKGRIRIIAGSGAIIQTNHAPIDCYGADVEIYNTISLLYKKGVSIGEIIELAQSCALDHLTEHDRPCLAWIDCCIEMIEPVATEIRQQCGYKVVPLILEDIIANPKFLVNSEFHTVATTVVHYDNVRSVLKETNQPIERLVLSLTPQTISSIASIAPEKKIAIVSNSYMFSYGVKQYLSEFRVESESIILTTNEVENMINTGQRLFDVIILPPNKNFDSGACERIAMTAVKKGIEILYFAHNLDFGSLRKLKLRLFQ